MRMIAVNQNLLIENQRMLYEGLQGISRLESQFQRLFLTMTDAVHPEMNHTWDKTKLAHNEIGAKAPRLNQPSPARYTPGSKGMQQGGMQQRPPGPPSKSKEKRPKNDKRKPSNATVSTLGQSLASSEMGNLHGLNTSTTSRQTADMSHDPNCPGVPFGARISSGSQPETIPEGTVPMGSNSMDSSDLSDAAMLAQREMDAFGASGSIPEDTSKKRSDGQMSMGHLETGEFYRTSGVTSEGSGQWGSSIVSSSHATGSSSSGYSGVRQQSVGHQGSLHQTSLHQSSKASKASRAEQHRGSKRGSKMHRQSQLKRFSGMLSNLATTLGLKSPTEADSGPGSQKALQGQFLGKNAVRADSQRRIGKGPAVRQSEMQNAFGMQNSSGGSMRNINHRGSQISKVSSQRSSLNSNPPVGSASMASDESGVSVDTLPEPETDIAV